MERLDSRKIWNSNAPAWTALTRGGFDVYRDLVNTPAFLEILPPIAGQFGLDLGCGEGHHTGTIVDRGADVVALDISEIFIAATNERGDPRIQGVAADGASLPCIDDSFDFVTAIMSLMDVGAPEDTLPEVQCVLKPGGFMQFSVVHPLTSTPIRRWIDNDSGERDALAVGDYFYEGPITEGWIFGAAPKEVSSRFEPFTITYPRRTLSGRLEAVLQTNLDIEAVAEPSAGPEIAEARPEVAHTRIAPYFLIVRARNR